jgi:hypothetical protein
MANKDFPELRYSRLRELRGDEQAQVAFRMVTLFVEILETHGPLPVNGLVYFARKDHQVFLANEDVHLAVAFGHDERVVDGLHAAPYDNCYRTLAQQTDETPLTIPNPTNYDTAFYQLYELLEAARQDPSLLKAPTAFLVELGLYPLALGQ